MSIVKSYAPMDVRGSLSIATLDDFPADPRGNELIIKDGILWAHTLISGVLAWRPLTKRTDSYVHTQGAPALTWYVNHNLGTIDLIAIAYDADGVPQHGQIGFTDENQITLEFAVPVEGRAVIFADANIGIGSGGPGSGGLGQSAIDASVAAHDADAAAHADIRALVAQKASTDSFNALAATVAGKADSGHNHDGAYSAVGHSHAAPSHESTTGLQGGAPNDRFHLTGAERGIVAGYIAGKYVNNAASGAIQVDLQNGDVSAIELTLAGATTLSVTNAPAGMHQLAVRVKQDATGGRALSWSTGFKAPKAGAPSLSTTANEWEWLAAVKMSGATYDLIKSGGPYV